MNCFHQKVHLRHLLPCVVVCLPTQNNYTKNRRRSAAFHPYLCWRFSGRMEINMSNEMLKIISNMCFCSGGLFAVVSIVLSLVTRKGKKPATKKKTISVEYELTYIYTDTIIEWIVYWGWNNMIVNLIKSKQMFSLNFPLKAKDVNGQPIRCWNYQRKENSKKATDHS